MLLVFIAGCKKYEDGPWLSLRTKTARITGWWKFEYFSMNGNDSTSAFINSYQEDPYYAILPKDQSGEKVLKTVHGYGNWSFHDHNNYLHLRNTNISPTTPITLPYNSGEVFWKVLRLTNKELWLSIELNQNTYEAHLKKIAER